MAFFFSSNFVSIFFFSSKINFVRKMAHSLLSALSLVTCFLAGLLPHVKSNIIREYRNDFADPQNFEGWNCGKITTCGELGQVCGGYNTKAASSDITKTFNLPAGTYSVELDFIKLDTWFVYVMRRYFGSQVSSGN